MRVSRSSGVAALVLTAASVTAALSPCHAEGPLALPTNPENVIVIVADDMGVDVTSAYFAFPPLGIPDTPVLNSLASGGVVFLNAWAFPVCSPTRAAVQTGRYGFRNGITGSLACESTEEGINLENQWLLPKILTEIFGPAEINVASAAIGKWHLNGKNVFAPNDAGYAHYSGALCNFTDGTAEEQQEYDDWIRTRDASQQSMETYATSVNVDDAVEWIEEREDEEAAWFLWLAFNAPHTPYHRPPEALYNTALPEGNCDGMRRKCYQAAIEAMDTEIGRLLDELESMPNDVLDRTTIVFMGDNGTPGLVTVAPFDPAHAKATLYQGGIHVPLIISGPHVDTPGLRADALVSVVDVFATTLNVIVGDDWEEHLELALPDAREIDSVSLLPIVEGDDPHLDVREFNYSEFASEEGVQAIRNLERVDGVPVSSYKLIRFESDPPELYELLNDPRETANLYPPEEGEEELNFVALCEALNELDAQPEGLDCTPPLALDPEAGYSAARGAETAENELLSCFPNPATGATVVEFSPAVREIEGNRASVRIHDVSGSLVRELWSGPPRALIPRFDWDGRDGSGNVAASGVYYVRFDVDLRTIVSRQVVRME